MRLPDRFDGWDTHNYLSLAIDLEGQLHVSGDMHASPLNYFMTSAVGDVTSLRRASMIGRDESRMTYPTFVSTSDGRLLYLYREGVSGDAVWIVNARDRQGWRRLLDQPLFADADMNGPVSAYPSKFVAFPDGSVQVAVVWRRPGDVARSYAATAKAEKLLHWRAALDVDAMCTSSWFWQSSSPDGYGGPSE